MRFLNSPEIPVLAAAPPSPAEGETYYDSSLDALRVYAEGEWRDHASSGQAIFVGDTQPVTDVPKYVWVQTGLPGDGITFWVETGENP